ncbi:MAG: cell division protein FtsZ [Hyphomicrobiales bacterium]|nr:cell division protein FtsZ [Hyphomicrobiales bacterium]
MTINLTVPFSAPAPELRPRITVVGVGGAGGNAVNNMIRSGLEGVEFVVANTDSQALAQSACDRRIQMGTTVTQGLGAGSRPDIGRIAAEEALDELIEEIRGCNMVFIAAGMGGGTGTGAAPVIARAAREQGILTVGVVTKPFHFEGAHRMRIAETGIEDLEQFVDTLIIIPNQNLFRIANDRTTFADAFKMADDVLYSGVRGVTDLMVMPGLINLDFADIRAVMSEMGKAMMGTGMAEGDRRSLDAAEAAISNPLLDDVSMKGARGVLINITGGADITLFEVDEAANRIRSEVDPDAFIIFGSTFDETMDGKIRVSVVATGMDAASMLKQPTATAGHGEAADELDGHGHQASGDVVTTLTGADLLGRNVSPEQEVAHALQATAQAGHGGGAGEMYADEHVPSMSNVFIPPEPVNRGSAARRVIEPVRAAVGGGQGRDGVGHNSALGRVSTLFARVTGGRGRTERFDGPVEAPHSDAPEAKGARRLGGVSPDERLPSSQAEEDLLDIPAFLRRQAN